MKRTIILLFLIWLPASQAAAAAAWHTDERAEIRFLVPFDSYVEKTAQQVEALLLADPNYQRLEAPLPDGLSYTSGLYAQDSDAFVLVWTTPRTELPSRAALKEMSRLSMAESYQRFGVRSFRFDMKNLRGVGRQPTRGGLRSRLLMQLTRDMTVYVGYYFSKREDAARFEPLVASLEVNADQRLNVSELERGIPAALPMMMTAIAAVFAMLGMALLIQRVYRYPHRSSADHDSAERIHQVDGADHL